LLTQDEDEGEIDTEYLQSQLKKQMDKFKSEKLAEKNQNEISKVLEENELGSKHGFKSSRISISKPNEIIVVEDRNAPNPQDDVSSSNEEVTTEKIDESESDDGK
jgi:ribosomal protein L20A (L18A)